MPFDLWTLIIFWGLIFGVITVTIGQKKNLPWPSHSYGVHSWGSSG